jgi:cbb3-type cytochrome oxidase subunit 3
MGIVQGIITLILTIAFIGLIIWVFWPSKRDYFESQGKIPFDKKQQTNQEDSTDHE